MGSQPPLKRGYVGSLEGTFATGICLLSAFSKGFCHNEKMKRRSLEDGENAQNIFDLLKVVGPKIQKYSPKCWWSNGESLIPWVESNRIPLTKIHGINPSQGSQADDEKNTWMSRWKLGSMTYL